MFCSKCGNKLKKNEKLCRYCESDKERSDKKLSNQHNTKIFIIVIVILGFLIASINTKITGKNLQLIKECESERPLQILKSIGVKKIADVEKTYDSSTHKSIKVIIDGEREIEIDIVTLHDDRSHISIINADRKRINEIINNSTNDDFAYYYNDLQNEVITLDNQLMTQKEVQNKVDETKLSIFEKNSGTLLYYLKELIIVSIILAIIYLIVRNQNKKSIKKMETLNSHKAAMYIDKLIYKNGIPIFIEGEKSTIFMCEDGIEITNDTNEKRCTLKYKKIMAIGSFTESQITKNTITKNGNVIGNGLLGGFLFGPAGMFLGATSSIGSKTKTVTNKTDTHYVIINYKAENEKIKSISFVYNTYRLEIDNFINEVKKKIPENNMEL